MIFIKVGVEMCWILLKETNRLLLHDCGNSKKFEDFYKYLIK